MGGREGQRKTDTETHGGGGQGEGEVKKLVRTFENRSVWVRPALNSDPPACAFRVPGFTQPHFDQGF